MGNNGIFGNVAHFYKRFEYQDRGTTHVHCLLWIKDAPIIGQNKNEEVLKYIEERITCRLPNEKNEPELFDKVQQFQLHKHTRILKINPQL